MRSLTFYGMPDSFRLLSLKTGKRNSILCSDKSYLSKESKIYWVYCLGVTVPLIIKTNGEFTAFEFTVIDLVNAPTLLVL